MSPVTINIFLITQPSLNKRVIFHCLRYKMAVEYTECNSADD